MKSFTLPELTAIRSSLALGSSMARICSLFPTHTRDEMVEAIDAIKRWDTLDEPLRRVNAILVLQAEGVPLINGKPAWYVLRSEKPVPRSRYL